MAAVCSHQDSTRKGVGATAHLVATIRGLESKFHKDDALFSDPFADLLGGEVGEAYVKSFDEIDAKPFGVVDGVAVRTKKIDDEIATAINGDGFEQICVLGAGLDTRAWRISIESSKVVHYFEVDFPEIFDYKLPLLASVNAPTSFQYHSVMADLSLPMWPDVLIASGFDPKKPTLWLMEGLIGYLTEDEANSMFNTVTTRLSAPQSRIVATFLTPATQAKTHMHRFFPENPLAVVNAHGWSGVQHDIEVLGVKYNRPIRDQSMQGYYIVVADLP